MGKKNKVNFKKLIEDKGIVAQMICQHATEDIIASAAIGRILGRGQLKTFHTARAEAHTKDLFILLFERDPEDDGELERQFLDFIFDKADKELGFDA